MTMTCGTGYRLWCTYYDLYLQRQDLNKLCRQLQKKDQQKLKLKGKMNSKIADSCQYPAFVYIDLETTGFEKDCDILQISAICGDHKFDQYILPAKPIQPKAAEKHNILINGDKIYYMNKPVKYTDPKNAMQMFSQYLTQFSGGIILAAHNGYKYDFPRLSRVMNSVHVEFPRCVKGFLDTLNLMRILYPGLKSHSLKNLVAENYEAHNALADAEALQNLMLKTENEQGIEKWFGAIKQCVRTDWISM